MITAALSKQDLNMIADTLEKIAEGIQNNRVIFEALPATKQNEETGAVARRAPAPKNTIDFLRPFFYADDKFKKRTTPAFMAAVMFHELSHLFGSTEDYT